MNPSMYLVAVLALCALPSALGLTCYKCTSNETAGELCNNMTSYHTETCQGAGAHCARTEIMTSVSADLKAYILGCVDEPHNCTSYQTSLCANVTAEATARSVNVTKCVSTCCNKDKCITAPTSMPPTTATGTGTGTGTDSTAMSTTAAGVTFRPELIGLLLTVLSAVYFGVQ